VVCVGRNFFLGGVGGAGGILRGCKSNFTGAVKVIGTQFYTEICMKIVYLQPLYCQMPFLENNEL